jgi:hypothetical protein
MLAVIYRHKNSLELRRNMRLVHKKVEEENMEIQSRLSGVGDDTWLKVGCSYWAKCRRQCKEDSMAGSDIKLPNARRQEE